MEQLWAEQENIIKKLKTICTESTESARKLSNKKRKRVSLKSSSQLQYPEVNISSHDLDLKPDYGYIKDRAVDLLPTQNEQFKYNNIRVQIVNGTDDLLSTHVRDTSTQEHDEGKICLKNAIDGTFTSSSPKMLRVHSNLSPIPSLDDSTSRNIKKEQLPQIFIVGGKQCSGLASEIIHSRQNTNYMKYLIEYVR